MASITAPTFDPTTTATAMAQKFTAGTQELLNNQTNDATARKKALTTLGSAISSFQTSLSTLTGLGKTMLAQSAKLSDTAFGTASAKATATPGNYSVFVEQLATASRNTYDGILPSTDVAANSSLTLAVGGQNIVVPLTGAASKAMSPRDVAAAINGAPDNQGRIAASVVTDGTAYHLILTSTATGATPISIPTGGDPSNMFGSPSEVKTGQDAKLTVGGIPITQASNTFTNIDGVTFTATRAHAPGETPLTLTVAKDTSATSANVQAFVDAYNKLKSAVDSLAAPGGTSSAPGAFANDAGVKALQSRLASALRTGGSPSLASYGIIAARDGTLTLDSARLNKQLAANPDGLDKLIGTANSSAPTGIAGALDKYLDQWSDSVNGQIKQRGDANTKLQAALAKRQDTLQMQYDAAYQRYLKQFSDLQTLQSTMNSNVSMFDALFGNKDS